MQPNARTFALAAGLGSFAAALSGAFAQGAPKAATPKAPASQPASAAGKEVPAPKEGVSDAVKQAFIEDQKEKSKK